MERGKPRATGQLRAAWACTLGAFLAGCATPSGQVCKSLMTDRSAASRDAGVAETYQIFSPDVLEIESHTRQEFSKRHTIGPDGRIELGDYGSLRVTGHTPAEVATLIAQNIGVAPAEVKVRVADHRSQFVVVCGEVVGGQRAVPYQGQETVVDLLQRAGGVTAEADPDEVYVVRPHLGGQRRAEVLKIDLHAIVLKRDEKTNVRLMPHDTVYVGETRQANIEKALPSWAIPAYRALWDMRRETGPGGRDQAPVRSRWIAGLTQPPDANSPRPASGSIQRSGHQETRDPSEESFDLPPIIPPPLP